MRRWARSGIMISVSIGGGGLEGLVRLSNLLQGRQEVAALEIDLSVLDREPGTPHLGHIDRAVEATGAVSRMSLVPVFAKIPLHSGELVALANALVHAGVHGLTIGGPPPAIAIDAERLRPALGAVVGRLSGPAIKPLMMRAVFDVSRSLPDTPIVASGGIRSGEDAVEAMLAGAWAVQLGTATLVDPHAPVLVAQGIARYLKSKGLASPRDVRAQLRLPPSLLVPVDDGEVRA